VCNAKKEFGSAIEEHADFCPLNIVTLDALHEFSAAFAFTRISNVFDTFKNYQLKRRNSMVRLPGINAALVTLALLAGVACASARSSEAAISLRSGTAMRFQALAPANHAIEFFVFWDRHDSDDERDKGWDRDNHSDNDGDNDADGNHDDPHAPSPTPEPSTLLSFGAAALIGGAVIYSRRLLGNRK
jgi:hypothetical protein